MSRRSRSNGQGQGTGQGQAANLTGASSTGPVTGPGPSPGTGTNTNTTNGNGGTQAQAQIQVYNPSHFVVPGQDHKGHSVRLWCRIQPTCDHEIEAIVQSHNWPFKTKGDFARWAIWEGVKRIEKMAPVPGSMIVVAEAILESCKASAHWLAFKSSVDSTEQTVRSLIDSGNEEEALKLLSNLRTQVMKLEEASWREQWLNEWNKRFGHIWARAREKAVDLSQAARG
jgi:hypothetical protein